MNVRRLFSDVDIHGPERMNPTDFGDVLSCNYFLFIFCYGNDITFSLSCTFGLVLRSH